MVSTEQEQEQEAPHVNTRFHISLERVASQGRSLQLLLQQRRCASCWGSLMQEPKGGRDITASRHLSKIASHCSKTDDFINSDMPLAEAIFRILLSNANKPMTTQQIYEGLNERWVDPINPRIPEMEGIYRIMSHDTFYGLKEVPDQG
ncbi:MAG: hypothetical protein O7F09_03530 [Chloroflexi bacterium]|nr:hypothetical protein [Chloroflexota bacterium]MCZ6891568.1 hypothetical protein [Chloroflexota bacterium]